jgi:hypothetical protein
MRWLLPIYVLVVFAGCSGSLQPGRLPSPEELCAIQRGVYSAGVCHTSGGA